jgi:hypothetical protein
MTISLSKKIPPCIHLYRSKFSDSQTVCRQENLLSRENFKNFPFPKNMKKNWLVHREISDSG